MPTSLENIDTISHSGTGNPTVPETFDVCIDLGPDKGRRTTFGDGPPVRILVGQGELCDVRLTDRTVSRRHAAIDRSGGRLRLCDLGSTNGTFIDGVPIIEALLQPGSVVRTGDTAWHIEARRDSSVPKLRTGGFGRFIGGSPEINRLVPLLERLAASDIAVIVEGETGTGKEVLAEALHEMGPRASRPYVVFDCTSVPSNLLESELFGHERGAFTGAATARMGVLEAANGGTLLIDEIGDLDATLQPKLLRAMDRQEFRRLGGTRSITVDVRIIAATRRNLDEEVERGRFRDDLLHRLAVGRIELPPLRDRTGDVELLARHFWASLGQSPHALPSAVVHRWMEYRWPGNVRELRNAVARFAALGDMGLATARAASTHAGASERPAANDDIVARTLAERLPFPLARQQVVDEFERRYVERVLEEHQGNVTQAAAASGIARRYLQLIRARQTK